MIPEHTLREELRKIAALFAGAATPSEKTAAVPLQNVFGSVSARPQARKSQRAEVLHS